MVGNLPEIAQKGEAQCVREWLEIYGPFFRFRKGFKVRRTSLSGFLFCLCNV